jgi:Asp-tRNA(Asn)/Glu-tRNA(Gln) amidotransferase A subunit family amidase
MSGTEICFMSATQLLDAYKAKNVSPVEAVDAMARRIGVLNPTLNAYCQLRLDEARAEAKVRERELMQGTMMPLHGVPFSIKDMTAVAGMPTTFGSRAMVDAIAAEDAPIVERLKRAGAIFLGKTNLPEFAYKGTTDNLLFGATRNPWNTKRIAGGSSGGGAAAVAAGMGPLAEGTDGGGSIRIPASCCGVYGLKPSVGRVPHTLLPNRFLLAAHTGPITRTVADAALMMDVIAGPDERDPLSLPAQSESYLTGLNGGVRGARIAFSVDLGFAVVHPEIAEITRNAAQAFFEAGAQVEEVRLDCGNPESAMWVMWRSLYSTIADLVDLEKWAPAMTPHLVEIIRDGCRLTAREYLGALTAASAFYDRLRSVFATYEFIVSPVLACEPFEIGIEGPTEINGKPCHPIVGWLLTYPFNMTGHPACSIPCGFTRSGLPVGLQIIARRHQDAALLRASAAFESVRPWALRHPDL